MSGSKRLLSDQEYRFAYAKSVLNDFHYIRECDLHPDVYVDAEEGETSGENAFADILESRDRYEFSDFSDAEIRKILTEAYEDVPFECGFCAENAMS